VPPRLLSMGVRHGMSSHDGELVLGIPTIRTLNDLPVALASIDEYSVNSGLDSRSVRLQPDRRIVLHVI